MPGAIDRLELKLTRSKVRAHLRRTEEGAVVPVVSYSREVSSLLKEFDIPDTETNRRNLSALVDRQGVEGARKTLGSVHSRRWVVGGGPNTLKAPNRLPQSRSDDVRILLPHITFTGFEKLKPEAQREHTEALVKLNERYPELMLRVKSVRVDAKRTAGIQAFGEIRGGAMGHSLDSPVEFVLSPKAGASPQYNSAKASGYLVGGTLFHEFGHLVYGTLNHPRNANAVGMEPHDALRKLGTVSKWAEESDDEAFSEAFALYMLGDERAAEFGRVVDAALKRASG